MARRIVIVGGGAAGTLVALQIARHARSATQITIVEPRERLGEGVAYGTSDPSHLLNVPAGGMSAHAEEPRHFVDWARCGPGDFVPRGRYAEYLRAELAARLGANPRAAIRHVRGFADGIDAATLRTTTVEGESLDADAVVLALGNAAPTRPAWLSSFRSAPVVADPWIPDAFDDVGAGTRVLCVGTGLTFVDIAISLAKRGAIVTGVSRHGLLPQVHAPFGPSPTIPAELGSPVAVSRWLRSHADWRAAFAALRPETQRLWRAFSPAQQAGFLRHARRHWDAHRHRMPAAVAEELSTLIDSGVIEVRRGDARTFAESGEFGRLVLCTGPDDAELTRLPPLARLLAEGVARAGPHGMGLDADADTGQIVDARGRLVDGIFTIGTIRRGTLWESTAIPEIRVEARRLATLLLS